MKEPKIPTSFRLTPAARDLVVALAEKMGVSQTAVIELALRMLAKKEKV
jgi:hypothetical protein